MCNDENPFEFKIKLSDKSASMIAKVKQTISTDIIKSNHEQVILGQIPSKSNCYRIIILKSRDKSKEHASLAKSQDLKKYEEAFYLQCNKYRNRMIEAFSITVDVYYPNNRSDLDNSLKVLLDCLQVVKAIKNDNQCVRIVTNKHLDKINPRVEFTLSEIKTAE